MLGAHDARSALRRAPYTSQFQCAFVRDALHRVVGAEALTAPVTLANVDLADCAQEPIHIPGFIQPHAYCLLSTWTAR